MGPDDERQALHAELERVRLTFARHVAEMNPGDLRAGSNGTRWTNRQLLFHMLFGYLLVRNLLWMVKVFGRLPRWTTKPFAAVLKLLDATVPLDQLRRVGLRRLSLHASPDAAPSRSSDSKTGP